MSFGWFWSFALSLPPIFGWGSFRPESNGMSCAPSWRNHSDIPYNIFLFSLGFFLPLAMIILSSLSVIFILRRNVSTLTSKDVKKSALERERKVLIMVKLILINLFFYMILLQIGVLIFVFLLCWTPYAILSLAGILGLAQVIILNEEDRCCQFICLANSSWLYCVSSPACQKLRFVEPCNICEPQPNGECRLLVLYLMISVVSVSCQRKASID